MTAHGQSFKDLRAWRGSQDQGFEELCYQLRDSTPVGAELVKTGNPDGGLEWYVNLRNGVQWGWQAKYTFDTTTLLKLMEKSLRTVIQKRPKCRRLTFCIPYDLSDVPEHGNRKSARQKFEDRKVAWRERIPGVERVHIKLWTAGELLERIVHHSNRRGIEWFFWNKEVFSPDWCAQRQTVAVKAAGGRYSPELHVELPLAFALEGLALSTAYWKRYRALRGAVLKAASGITVSLYTGIGITPRLRSLTRSLAEWRREVPSCVELPNRLDRNQLLSKTRDCIDAVYGAFPPTPPRSGQREPRGRGATGDRRPWLRYELQQLASALREFENLLQHSATAAATSGALLLTGEAGQGKTHLFCDASQRAVDARRPAVALFGGRFSGRRVWSDIAEQFGLSNIGAEELIGGMQAAAEASNAPFLLLIDALNEAAEPAAWQEELPFLLAEVASSQWVSIGISLRSTYRPVVLPANGLSDVVEVEHPGFAGRELEATERFFDAYGLEQPRVPVLEPEFTNPLFLKLYCEGLEGSGLSAPRVGEAHISAVFESYLESKAPRIVSCLGLDPEARSVEAATDALSEVLAAENRDSLPRDHVARIVNQFAPGFHRWPDTMLGQMLSEGVLTADVAWQAATEQHVQVIRFTYQRFGEYRVGSVLLKPFSRDPEKLRAALAVGKPLRRRLLRAPAGWIEALSVQIPEQFNIELLDATRWRLDVPTRYLWDRAFVRSISARRPDTMTSRSRILLSRVQRRTKDLRGLVLETLLTVAPSPEHPLNANTLHDILMRLSMPERDATWSIPTYFAFDDGGPLDRLIRWASRGPYPDCPKEVAELAAVTLAWTFTSPNRRMRDHAAKALTRLLSGSLAVLPSLIRRFDGVNDPYVMERLAVVAYGTVLSGGSGAPESALDAAQELRRVALDERQVPNIITRDAVRGMHEWCLRHDLISEETYHKVSPPYRSEPPKRPFAEGT